VKVFEWLRLIAHCACRGRFGPVLLSILSCECDGFPWQLL